MENEYEQMTLGTRTDLEKEVANLTWKTIRQVEEMLNLCAQPRTVSRERHTAYGVAAQHVARINGRNKIVRKTLDGLLITLEDPAANAAMKADDLAREFRNLVVDCILGAAEVSLASRDLLGEGAEPYGE